MEGQTHPFGPRGAPKAPPEPPAPATFDDTRKALAFALNAHRVEMPRPFMNKAMARAAPKAPRKARKRAKLPLYATDEALALLEAEEAAKARKSGHYGPRPLVGLDRAHAAGFILAQLGTLDRVHQLVLSGRMIQAYEPCSCRAPCCSGSRRNARWAGVVLETCAVLKEAGDVLRQPGRRGLSTQPAMRLAIVEKFYTGSSLTVAALAEIGKVSTMTATRHRDWIFEYLEQAEDEAWQRADALFDRVGITGPAG